MPIFTKLKFRTKTTGSVVAEDLSGREVVFGNDQDSVFIKNIEGDLLKFSPIKDTSISENSSWSATKIQSFINTSISGYSGHSGYSGYSGTSGYSGIDGAASSQGASGYSGYSGSGISGYSGSGISGYSGYSGYSGSGISGYSGYSGISGYSGLNGEASEVGASGYSGYSGSGISGYSGSGISGYSGSGISGYSGYSGYSGGSGIPAGSSTYVQYNNSGVFAGSADLTFSSSTLTVNGQIVNSSTTVGNKIQARTDFYMAVADSTEDDRAIRYVAFDGTSHILAYFKDSEQWAFGSMTGLKAFQILPTLVVVNSATGSNSTFALAVNNSAKWYMYDDYTDDSLIFATDGIPANYKLKITSAGSATFSNALTVNSTLTSISTAKVIGDNFGPITFKYNGTNWEYSSVVDGGCLMPAPGCIRAVTLSWTNNTGEFVININAAGLEIMEIYDDYTDSGSPRYESFIFDPGSTYGFTAGQLLTVSTDSSSNYDPPTGAIVTIWVKLNTFAAYNSGNVFVGVPDSWDGTNWITGDGGSDGTT